MHYIKNIAIVGAGPSGLSIYLQLIKELHHELKSITIFDPKGISNSFSFKSELESSLTNTSVGVSSLYADDKLDFHKWLQDKKPELKASASDFVSRSYFNEYSKDRFIQSKNFASVFGCITNICKKEVKEILFTNNKFTIRVLNSKDYQFDAIILATGINNSVPSSTYGQCENFISCIYPESNFLKKLKPSSNVLILGSKLSAIDVAIAIHQQSKESNIKMVSRSGELPSVRSSLLIKNPIPNWNSIIVDHLYLQSSSDKNVITKLEKDILKCQNKLNTWEDAIGLFIEEFNHNYPMLSLSEQQKAISKYEYFIKQYVSSFPINNAKIILKAFKQGKLSIIKKELPEYLYIKNNRIYGKNNNHTEDFDLVINASGISNKSLSNGLIEQLSDYSVQINEKGGLRLDSQTMKVLSNNNMNLYAIGGPAYGEIPITNYVRSSTIQAQKIVNNILSETRDYEKQTSVFNI